MANDMRPLVGHSFTFKAKPTPWWDGIVHCEVLEIDLHKRLRYSWRSGPEPSRLDTVVTWTLTPTQSGGTRLVLEHFGFLPGFAFDGAKKGGSAWLAICARCWRGPLESRPELRCERPWLNRPA
jgi:uncharacterized protein YndB with AHSA1/START domain